MMKKEKPKDNGRHAGGRPPKITKRWCKETAKTLPSLFQNGESITEVVVKLGISWDSWSKACEISPEFSEAKKEGLKIAEAWWCKVSRAAVMGKIPGFNSTVWIFSMKNRFKWRDKVELTGKDGGPIETTDPRQMLRDRVAGISERIRSKPDTE